VVWDGCDSCRERGHVFGDHCPDFGGGRAEHFGIGGAAQVRAIVYQGDRINSVFRQRSGE
jgi:hypothetical protein